MATAFTTTVKPSGGDYTTLNGAIAANACNLTSATKVFAHGSITGTISDGAAVTGLTSGATGTCTHATATQMMIKTITGTFQSGEVVYETLSVNFTTINDAGDAPYLSVEIDGDWSGGADTTTVSITGYTTSATSYINIYTTAQARHKGVWSTSYYINTVSANPGFAISEDYVTITGLQIQNSRGTGALAGIGLKLNNIEGIVIDSCIVRSHRDAINIANTSSTVGWQLRNSIFMQYATAVAIDTAIVRGVGKAYNCVFINLAGARALYDFGAPVVQYTNCYFYSSGTTIVTDGVNFTFTTCASVDGAESTATVAYSTSSGAYFTNVTGGSEDFHIGASSELKDAGTDLSGTFTTDIDGNTRSGTWDIGVDEFVGAASSSTGIMTPRTGYWGDL